MLRINVPEDIFKSQDMTNKKQDFKTFEVVDILFCDNSGFGSPRELALTPSQLKLKVAELLKEAKDSILYSGITGIGQFQVYITIWKRKGR